MLYAGEPAASLSLHCREHDEGLPGTHSPMEWSPGRRDLTKDGVHAHRICVHVGLQTGGHLVTHPVAVARGDARADDSRRRRYRDVAADPNAPRGLYPRWHEGRLRSGWDESGLADAYCRRVLSRNATRAGCDAVLEIQDLAPLDLPYYLYQDMSYDALIQLVEAGQPIFRKTSRDTLRRRQERQRSIYAARPAS